jgi:hypothetical protein
MVVVKTIKFLELDNIYISSSRRTYSRSRAPFREITEPRLPANDMLLASAILVFPFGVDLVILGPRASSDRLHLILSNPVYHPSNSV